MLFTCIENICHAKRNSDHTYVCWNSMAILFVEYILTCIQQTAVIMHRTFIGAS